MLGAQQLQHPASVASWRAGSLGCIEWPLLSILRVCEPLQDQETPCVPASQAAHVPGKPPPNPGGLDRTLAQLRTQVGMDAGAGPHTGASPPGVPAAPRGCACGEQDVRPQGCGGGGDSLPLQSKPGGLSSSSLHLTVKIPARELLYSILLKPDPGGGSASHQAEGTLSSSSFSSNPRGSSPYHAITPYHAII